MLLALLALVLTPSRAETTHYHTLSITRKASQADVKAAYRSLALRYHPDKPEGNPERFRRILSLIHI